VSSRVLAIAAICAVAAIGAAFVFLPRRAPVPAGGARYRRPAASPAPAAGGAAAPRRPAAPAVPRPRAARPEAAASARRGAPAVGGGAPDAGTLRIESDVPGAQVFIDRQFIGTTPVTAANSSRARTS
jgi:hypothetical protein